MKLAHISDLHLGIRLCEYSFIEDQRHILAQILNIIAEEGCTALLIAGDIYDKSMPTAEAVALLDDFLCSVAGAGVKVIAAAGNHDSPERIAFGGRLMEGAGVYMSPVYNGHVEPVVLSDQYGELKIYPLPFMRAVSAARFFDGANITSGLDAMKMVIAEMNINRSERTILIAHAAVSGAQRADSESVLIGGADECPASVFADFDYTALGHYHSPQNVAENVRYCGTPLKYSFSEVWQNKSLTIIEAKSKGELTVSERPLVPLRDMREIKGTFAEITSPSFRERNANDDYMHIILTDELDIPDAAARLRQFYPYLMRIDYDNTRTRAGFTISSTPEAAKSPTELFSEFYKAQNGADMNEAQIEYINSLIDEIWQ